MAIIHNTTMSPGKLELLTAWLPAQPWYPGSGRGPELAKAGGFRLDDPEGEVGIEFMVVTGRSGDRAIALHVPLTYRARPLAGRNDGLIGTAEHGVLGHRWIYDGTRDPVLVTQLVALVQGDAKPQAQSVSNTADPTVISWPVTGGSLTVTGSAVVADGPDGTDLQIQTALADGTRTARLILRINRVLQPADGTTPPGGAWQPCLSATWQLPDGTRARGILAAAQEPPSVPA